MRAAPPTSPLASQRPPQLEELVTAVPSEATLAPAARSTPPVPESPAVPSLVPSPTARPCSSSLAGTGTSVPPTRAPAPCPAPAAAPSLVVLLAGCMVLAMAASRPAAEAAEEATAARAAASAHSKSRPLSWLRTPSAGTEPRRAPQPLVRVCTCTILRRYRIRGVRRQPHAPAVRCDYHRVTLPFTTVAF